MKYPNLVRKSQCKIPCNVTLYGEGISEEGAPIIAVNVDLYCNYQDRGSVRRDSQRIKDTATGACYFIGDIAPDLPLITSGLVEIFGVKRNIVSGSKGRNPDGSVNFTRLDLE